MGKLLSPQHPQIHHFSHPHPLDFSLIQNPIYPQAPPCSACKLPLSGDTYTCCPCNFTLHASCVDLPQLITHPSHPSHSLSLLSVAAYPAGIFKCDACGHTGDGFSYHCHFCEFDVHVLCASKPMDIVHPFHQHQLSLTFVQPYRSKAFSCDVCLKIGTSQWLYRCVPCEFDAHLDCATASPMPAPLQHHHSLPGTTAAYQNQPDMGPTNRSIPGPMSGFQNMPIAGSPNQPFLRPTTGYHRGPATGIIGSQYLNHSASTGGVQGYQSFAGTGASGGQSQQLGLGTDGSQGGLVSTFAGTGARGGQSQQLGLGTDGSQGGLVSTVMTELLGSAVQQVGQTLIQDIPGGDGGNGSNGGN